MRRSSAAAASNSSKVPSVDPQSSTTSSKSAFWARSDSMVSRAESNRFRPNQTADMRGAFGGDIAFSDKSRTALQRVSFLASRAVAKCCDEALQHLEPQKDYFATLIERCRNGRSRSNKGRSPAMSADNSSTGLSIPWNASSRLRASCFESPRP